MKDNESFLVVTSMIFVAILFIAAKSRPQGFNPIKRNMFFNKAKVPIYLKFLSIVGIFSILIGLASTKHPATVVAYAALNVGIGAIAGINIFLYQEKIDPTLKVKTSRHKDDWKLPS